MTNASFKDIEKLEDDLWEAADNRRANSKLTSSDYFMPVLGVIFLRHAANRFDAAQRQIEADKASGKMPKRKVRPEDYIARRSLYLPEKARYDWIMQQASVGGANLPRLVLNSPRSLEHSERRAVGATRPRIARRELAMLPLLLPPRRLQEHFRESAEPLHQQRAIIYRQNEKLLAARDLLLPRLMSGAIAV